MNTILAALGLAGGAVLFVIQAVLVLVLAAVVLVLLALLCPVCADLSWEGDPDGEGPGDFRVKVGALGLTFPVWQYPPPPPPPEGRAPRPGFLGRLWARLKGRLGAWRAKRRAQKPPKKKTSSRPRKKARLTLQVLASLLRGAGRLTRAVFDALRVTRIRLVWPVGAGMEPEEAARAYGSASAWLYGGLGVVNRFVYLDFEELRLVPVIGPEDAAPPARLSCRVSARGLMIAIAAVEVFIALYREKVLDVFL